MLNFINFHPYHENKLIGGQISSSNFSKSSGQKWKNFQTKLLVLTKFHFVSFHKIPTYFHMHENRNYLTKSTFPILKRIVWSSANSNLKLSNDWDCFDLPWKYTIKLFNVKIYLFCNSNDIHFHLSLTFAIKIAIFLTGAVLDAPLDGKPAVFSTNAKLWRECLDNSRSSTKKFRSTDPIIFWRTNITLGWKCLTVRKHQLILSVNGFIVQVLGCHFWGKCYNWLKVFCSDKLLHC